MEIYDVIIVGAGPAGLTAGIFALRRELKTLIISKDIGGQINLAHKIENYPCFLEISGMELAEKMRNHYEYLGGRMILDEVVEIKKRDNLFEVHTLYGKKFLTKTVILAIGRVHRYLGVPGEKELIGKGVSYCYTCDGPFFKNKVVAVVGGGDSAFRAAEFLSDIAEKVYLIHRRDSFRAEESIVKKVKEKSNVEFILNSVVKEIKGENKVESIIIENVKTKEIREIKLDGVFIEIGFEVINEMINKIGIITNERGEIVVDKNCSTNIKGIFAAGDCTDIEHKQIITACAMGAIAALSAYEYIKELSSS